MRYSSGISSGESCKSASIVMTTQQNKSFIDTLRITKEDHPHFESVDCPPAFFHQIKRVDYTKHTIDSVVIHNENVNYDATKAHFYIYFKSYLH